MHYSNGVKIYCKSMRKIFEVQHIAKSEEEANEFCSKNEKATVIAVAKKEGLIFIADKYSLTVPSDVLP